METVKPAVGYANRDVTQPPNWHFLVELDFFLNATTTGLFLVAAVCNLVRPDLFTPLAHWAYPIALVALLADLACLVFDLGNPARFHHMLRVFKLLSPMSLGTWCLTAYSVPLTLLVAADLFGSPGWLRIVLIVLTIPFAFASAAYKGVLFSTTAQPGWRDARWLGAYHTTGALVIGAATVMLLPIARTDSATDVLRTVLGMLVVLNGILLTLLVANLSPTIGRAGGAKWWLGTVMVGGVLLPLALLAIGGWLGIGFSVILVLITGFFVRVATVRLPHIIR
jgi:hypothetical protein